MVLRSGISNAMIKFERLNKEQKIKYCITCDAIFIKPKDLSNKQWLARKYCGQSCYGPKRFGRVAYNLGKNQSEETKQKISKALSGKNKPPRTKEHAEKIACKKRGQPSPLKGIKTGRKNSEEFKDNLRKRMMGNKYKLGKPSWISGKNFLQITGDKNPNWKGGISKKNKTERQLFMETIAYKNWRKSVFKRDNYTCQECNSRGKRLNADHIKPYSLYPELRVDINNGRTLCVECHRKTQTYGFGVYKYGSAA